MVGCVVVLREGPPQTTSHRLGSSEVDVADNLMVLNGWVGRGVNEWLC